MCPFGSRSSTPGGQVFDRRTFLGLAGAVALSPLAACARAGADRAAGPTMSPGPPGPPLPRPDYTLGGPTPELLARTPPLLVTPRGTFTTSYEQPSPADGTTWDMRGARFVGYFDADAIYEVGDFAAGSSEHQQNNRPIRIGADGSVTGAAVVGGVVQGAQPPTLTWERMKYGQHVQDDTDRWVDAGRPEDVDPHAGQIDNRNQDGDPRIHVKPDGWAVWDALQVRNTHDGIGIYGDVASGPGAVYVRNCWLRDIHDDAIENDDWLTLDVLDSLVEGTYTFLSCQNHDLDGARTGSRVTVQDSVIRLRPFPGGYKTRSTDSAHGQIYKAQENAPGLVMRNVVVASERFRDPDGGALLPERVVDRYDGVTLVWLGSGRYPGNVPDGCRLTTDASAYDRAVEDWKARHGVGPDGAVDTTRMISPAPVAR